MEMIDGFLFYRVDCQSAWFAVDLTEEHATTIPPAAADATVTVGNAAVVRTEQALHPSAIQGLVISTFFRHVCF